MQKHLQSQIINNKFLRYYSTTIHKNNITREMILDQIIGPYGNNFENDIIRTNPSHNIEGQFALLFEKTFEFCRELKLLGDFSNQYKRMKATYIWFAYQDGKIKLYSGWFPENNNNK